MRNLLIAALLATTTSIAVPVSAGSDKWSAVEVHTDAAPSRNPVQRAFSIAHKALVGSTVYRALIQNNIDTFTYDRARTGGVTRTERRRLLDDAKILHAEAMKRYIANGRKGSPPRLSVKYHLLQTENIIASPTNSYGESADGGQSNQGNGYNNN